MRAIVALLRLPACLSVIARLRAERARARFDRRSVVALAIGLGTFFGALFGTSLAGGEARAEVPSASALEQWVTRSVALPGGARLRIEVSVGSIGRGVKLAPCERAEPFLPGQTKLWGRANVGLRCVAGARWTTFLPVRVAAFGPALLARQSMPAGTILRTADFGVQEVDWAERNALPIADATQLANRELIRPITAGQPLLTDHVRITPSVRAGEPVTVLVAGQGFSIGTEAVALASAADGQRIRVRTPAGKVLEGTLDRKTVRITR